MSAASYTGRRRHEGVLFGVCAAIANNTGLPAWLPRVVFVFAGLGHLFLATIAYGGLAYWFAKRNAPTSTGNAGLRERFGSLEQRLRGLEATAMSGEAELRRQFRDLR